MPQPTVSCRTALAFAVKHNQLAFFAAVTISTIDEKTLSVNLKTPGKSQKIITLFLPILPGHFFFLRPGPAG